MATATGFSVVSGVFPKLSRTFIESSEFRESDKSLKRELGPIEGSCLLPVFYCIVVIPWSPTPEVAGSNNLSNIFLTEFNEFSETFRKNSNRSSSIKASSVFHLQGTPVLILLPLITINSFFLNEWLYWTGEVNQCLKVLLQLAWDMYGVSC